MSAGNLDNRFLPRNKVRTEGPACATGPRAKRPDVVVPQMVMLTFDDGVHDHNYHYYSQLGLLDYWNPDSLTNPNGCPARATFFVSGDHTNMDLVVGMRAPYLVLGGDDQYSMLKDRGFLYDSSMNGGSLDQDPIWPFTLDFPPTPRACDSEWCPAGSYPRLWEVPIVLEALHEFLHVLSGMNDVWLVTMTQMLDWVRGYKKASPHWSHENGRSPVWIRRRQCRLRLSCEENPSPHWSHVKGV
nr:hypothetical protein BaRGS_024136 [Batillaria attramentaria]